MTDYEPKLNPNPTQRYDFTVTLIEAPTNLVVTNIWAIYESNCEQLVDKWAGAYKELTKEFPIEFKKIKPNVYHATVFGDKLLDETYLMAQYATGNYLIFHQVRTQSKFSRYTLFKQCRYGNKSLCIRWILEI